MPFSRRLSATVIASIVALVATLVVVAPQPVHAAAGLESRFVAEVNADRLAEGLPPLTVANDLTRVARQHSQQMTDAARLHHNPDLGSQVSGWRKVGENVGRGRSMDAIHAAFLGSPDHRHNILDPEWTEVSVGIQVHEGQLWVTQLFRAPSSRLVPTAVNALACNEPIDPVGADRWRCNLAAFFAGQLRHAVPLVSRALP